MALAVGGLFFWQNYKLQKAKFVLYSATTNLQQQPAVNGNSNNATSTATVVLLTAKIVANHNIASDCYLIINNKVYNVTSYLNLHPGGRGQIISYCGQDATQAFITKGGQGSHSGAAIADLAQLYIGDLGTPVTITTIKNNNTSQMITKPFSRNDDRDNEYEDD